MEETNVYRYGKDVTWSLPLLFQYEPVWGAIYKAFKHYGIELPEVNGFGSPAMAWTGGRAPAVFEKLEVKTVLKILNYLQEIKVTPSFAFTYTDVAKDDLTDRYANYLLDAALDVGAHFIVYSDLLKDYIKEKDPNAYVVASVIKPAFEFQGPEKSREYTVEKETQYYNRLLKEYDLVVVRPEYSNDVLLNQPDLIDDISRIEVLINQTCIKNCPRMPLHYKYLQNMRFGVKNDIQKFQCIRQILPNTLEVRQNTLAHSEDEIKKMINHGIRHLKIQGRGVGKNATQLGLVILMSMFKFHKLSNQVIEDVFQEIIDREYQEFGQILLECINKVPEELIN